MSPTVCPECKGCKEIKIEKARTMGYTLTPGETIDEHLIPCPSCVNLPAVPDNDAVLKKCFFCDSSDLVRFAEHYMFCRNCTAIYTKITADPDTECEHFHADLDVEEDKSMVDVERLPWFKNIREKVIKTKPFVMNGLCQMCGKKVNDAGW